jgi:putative phosphoribosyl transferase
MMDDLIFKDRREAGVQLAAVLAKRDLAGKSVVVFGIPRGGVITADEVAKSLSAPLDVLVARKIRAPNKPEPAIGAVTLEDNYFLNEELAHVVGATPDYLEREIARQRKSIEAGMKAYRGARPPIEVLDKTVIVVDDGLATGYTFRAALQSLSLRRPARLIAAAPVATKKSVEMIRPLADEVVCLRISDYFLSVATWYTHFEDVEDAQIIAILARNWGEHLKK